MAIEVEEDTIIARPRADVAAFMFDPRNDAEWTTGVVESRPKAKGLMKTGARVQRTVEFVGRRLELEYKVVAADSDSFVDMKLEEPFPMRIRYELEDSPKGTLVRIHASGDPGSFIRVAGPVLKLMAKRNIKSDLKALKKCVESAKPRRKK